MTIDELAQDVVGDMTKGDPAKISPLLLWVIEEVISLAIKWFMDHYKDEIDKAIEDFLNYFKNMNLFHKIQWGLKVWQVTKKHKDLGYDKNQIAGSVAGRFAALDAATVRTMFEQAISSQSH